MLCEGRNFFELGNIPQLDGVIVGASEEGVAGRVHSDGFERVRVGLFNVVDGIDLVLHDVLVDGDNGFLVLHV